jgi:hypothetical protein
MNAGNLEHLNLGRWPFHIVPSEETAQVWIGRPAVQRRLRKLVRSIPRVSASQLVLLWAAFGAGKTHALRHVQHLAREVPDVISLYVVTPKGIRSFLDIYKAIIDAAVNDGLIAAAGRDLFSRLGGQGRTDFERALIIIGTLPGDRAELAVSWLKAEKVPLRDLRDIGINRRLESTADGIEALNDLIAALQREGNVKLLFLLDEIQELAELGNKHDEAVGGLHKVFDRNTKGVTMILSFTTGSQAQVESLLGQTLFDRRSDVIALPPIDVDEGVELVDGLLRESSIDRDKAPYPFTPEALRAVVEKVDDSVAQLTPRAAIRALNRILRDADLDITDGEIEMVDRDYALARMAEESPFADEDAADNG